jgi:hypothetical protein
MIETAREDHPAVVDHLAGCAGCSEQLSRLTVPGRLLATAEPSAEIPRLRLGLRQAILARAGSAAPVRPAVPWRRSALAGTAAGLAAAVSLVAALHAGPSMLDPRTSAGHARTGDGFRIERAGNDVTIEFDHDGEKVHRIAMSTRPDFSTSKVTETQGRSWRDPAPAPIVGGVVFYRID